MKSAGTGGVSPVAQRRCLGPHVPLVRGEPQRAWRNGGGARVPSSNPPLTRRICMSASVALDRSDKGEEPAALLLGRSHA